MPGTNLPASLLSLVNYQGDAISQTKRFMDRPNVYRKSSFATMTCRTHVNFHSVPPNEVRW